MSIVEVFEVKKGHTKEDFLREALIRLGSTQSAPSDIGDIQFDEIKEGTKRLYSGKGYAEVDYTLSVGFDREEVYYEDEVRRDSDGTSRVVQVRKTRKVTDWQPLSGHVSGESIGYIVEDVENELGHLYVGDLVNGGKKDYCVSKGSEDRVIPDHIKDEVKRNCGDGVYWSVKLPGDHKKDEYWTSKVTLQSLECYIVPYYELKYRYKDEEHRVMGYAYGKPRVSLSVPRNNVDVSGIAKRKARPFKALSIISWILTPITFIVAGICSGNGIDINWPWTFFPIAITSGIVFTTLKNVVYKNTEKKLEEDAMRVKMDTINTRLRLEKLSPLTVEEKKRFDI